MNSEISKHYRDLIETNFKYFEKATIKSSVEEYKAELLKETAKIESEKDRNHNLGILKSFYNESLEALKESGEEMDYIMNSVFQNLKGLNFKDITKSIKEQIISSISTFTLKEEYNSFNGLFFEYSSSPSFSGIAFKERNFEVLLESPKYIKFEDGSYASDNSIDFELEDIFEDILGGEFEETAWVFEFELEIFLKVKETAYSIVALCLHDALKSEDVINKLKKCGFEQNGVVYLNEHDMENKSVYVNE